MTLRALISVFDKTGVVEFAKNLEKLNVEIVSTGGTKKLLEENDIKVTGISEITNFPECLDGRVKTLHPMVHAGILAKRDSVEHMNQLKDLDVDTIDLVVVNLYPFKETILKDGVSFEEVIENIDIGGPTMLRSAAKNFNDVYTVVDPKDYEKVIKDLSNETKSEDFKFDLATKVFEHTSSYDALIFNYLRNKKSPDVLPEKFTVTYEKAMDLRYGENPHQKACFYKEVSDLKGSLVNAVKLHGKELSFNNINDTNAALRALKEFEEPTVVGLKHANPCGVATNSDIYLAYKKAYEADPISIFGGIVAANREIDERIANDINKIFIEIVIAPSFSEKALEILKQKKNIRLLELKDIMEKPTEDKLDMKKVHGGILVQEIDRELYNDLKVVTNRIPTKQEMIDMKFAWKVVKSIKSNGIVVAKNNATQGVGPGQVNRIWASQNAINQSSTSLKGSVIASDAFFPFADSIEEAFKAGITAIIQPGGSIRDNEVIEKANEYGIAMVFTNMRHFSH
ncbi:bifunctional phosphoribosylaminoimidazolecarboxamide formyltransferase/IMP cyclohydrolase [Clostridiaceae bacterium HSG29]|nr:bifunctional phosphoribosylaminoimidazolecarboxamide formyltransferase/IMP cyclohydrolase [Clostridiaceae bacterium HSG29]